MAHEVPPRVGLLGRVWGTALETTKDKESEILWAKTWDRALDLASPMLARSQAGQELGMEWEMALETPWEMGLDQPRAPRLFLAERELLLPSVNSSAHSSVHLSAHSTANSSAQLLASALKTSLVPQRENLLVGAKDLAWALLSATL